MKLKEGVVAYWLKCWLAIERLQVRAPLGAGFFSPVSILSSTLKMRRCSSLHHVGPGELVNISAIPASLLATFGKNTSRKKIV